MNIRKAVITAASPGQRQLPLQTLVDRDSVAKSALQILIEEAASAGIEETCVVICPGEQAGYARAAGPFGRGLTFVEQPQPLGYGDALYCAREFVGHEPFLHMISDHLYLSTGSRRCARQLVDLAAGESCAVSAVQATRESMLPYYGTIGGRRAAPHQNVYEIESVVEKPTPTQAEQKLIIPGLRAGHYLCFFGMHVLTPAVMDLLSVQVKKGPPVQLSPALNALAGSERYLGMEVAGARHNIGQKYGLLFAQLALAMDGDDREDVLANLVELMANRTRRTQP